MFGVQGLRLTSGITLFFFLWLTLQPLRALAEQPITPTPSATTLEDALDDLRATAERAEFKTKRGKDNKTEKDRLLKHLPRLDGLESDAEADFAEVESHLKAHNLPDEIQARHRAAVADFHAKMDELKRHLRELDQAHGKKDRAHEQQVLGDLTAFLKKEQKRRPPQPFDPRNLPFRTPDEPARPAKEKKEELEPLLHSAKPVQVAAADLTPGLLAQTVPSLTPTPDDLAETEDVRITPAIRFQASVLHHNPVEIWNWVRNTIEFVPTYGSIQGSDLTLQTQRGNAFDTASLLIALLRASGIPARYVYGTIQVPADQVMNWVGGVTTPEAAQNLLGQGGIPATALVSGGKIAAFKLEHVWVSAFVDYIPSRGAVNRQGDTWVPLDGSFKQYTYTQGLDLKTAVPLDAPALVDQIKAGATINEAEGWAQNLDSATLQTTLADYQTRIKSYLDSQNPNATVGDILGTKTIVTHAYPILMGTLPYQTIATGSQFAQIPDHLHWKIRLNLYESEFDKATQTPQFAVAIDLSKLGTKRFAATYVPASEADAQVIQSYTTASRLPVYLVNEVLKIQIDNDILAEHRAQTMGAPQYWTYTLTKPGGSAVEEDFKLVSAVGDQIVFGIDGAGISQNQVSARFHSVDPNLPLENLNQLAMGYWARADLSDAIIAHQFKTIAYRLPSVGLFAQPLTVAYAWGIPRFGSYKSYSIDIRRLITSAVTIEGKPAVNFRFQSGLSTSQLEGRIFEEIFDLAPGNGFSAVAVIATAIRNGVPIWKVDSNNLQSFLAASILSPEVKTQISNAVSAGLLVLAPEEGVDVGFWAGQGYIAVDPKTGAGGYILNSANGGEFADCEEETVPLTQSISEQVLTFAAISLAAILIATGEIGSGGLATPAIVLAMTAVGISS
jgi:transglutaminase-like putative cysteine protease